MKEIILLIWSALITSGWWAIAIFPFPKKDEFGIMVFVFVITLMMSAGLATWLIIHILNNWDK